MLLLRLPKFLIITIFALVEIITGSNSYSMGDASPIKGAKPSPLEILCNLAATQADQLDKQSQKHLNDESSDLERVKRAMPATSQSSAPIVQSTARTN